MKIEPYIRKVNFYETDAMCIVHHSNYARWLEESRFDWMEKIGCPYQNVHENGIDFGVSSISTEFKSMIRYTDTVHIYSCISEISPVRITCTYSMFVGDRLCCTAETKHFVYHNGKQKIVSLKKEMPEVYKALEKHCNEHSGAREVKQ